MRIGIDIETTADGEFQITCRDSNAYLMNAKSVGEAKVKIGTYIDWITADPRHFDPENYEGVDRFDDAASRAPTDIDAAVQRVVNLVSTCPIAKVYDDVLRKRSVQEVNDIYQQLLSDMHPRGNQQ